MRSFHSQFHLTNLGFLNINSLVSFQGVHLLTSNIQMIVNYYQE